MRDGSVWEIPAEMIVKDMRKHFGNPLEEFDAEDICDWASGNMDWDDVSDDASIYEEPKAADYDSWWVESEKEIV